MMAITLYNPLINTVPFHIEITIIKQLDESLG